MIPCQFVGLTAGVRPNIDFIKNTSIASKRGILVNKYLETNQADIYAIGDCAEQQEPVEGRRAIEAVWYTGRMMGETLAKTIVDEKTAYRPGHWFNSAKFFDIEYQTYGWVAAHPDENESHFHWENREKNLGITIAFNKTTHEFLGINTFGLRMRHEIFDQILTEKRSVSHVIEHLNDCNFDPEFFTSYATQIVAKFNQEHDTNIRLKKKSWTRIFTNLITKE